MPTTTTTRATHHHHHTGASAYHVGTNVEDHATYYGQHAECPETLTSTAA
jgi:hypothetical protein